MSFSLLVVARAIAYMNDSKLIEEFSLCKGEDCIILVVFQQDGMHKSNDQNM